ncbi:hypothetical protein ACFPRL_32250 [Pseudoclavibacter helvolus]
MVLRSWLVRRAISLIVIPCRFRAWMSTLLLSESMRTGPSSGWCVVRDHQHRGRPASCGGATQSGEFR